MKNSAIDCSLNLNDNIKTSPNIKCLYFDNILNLIVIQMI